MALTKFQLEILQVIARNRNPNSHFAGGAVLNKDEPRISQDIDIFNDSAEILSICLAADAAALEADGYGVAFSTRSDTHVTADVTKHQSSNRIDWVQDSIWRFFPAVQDKTFGWRLHSFDLATNKILAFAGRREPRDYVDTIALERRVPGSLATLVWAAPGKDPGWTPQLILDEIVRNSRMSREDLAKITTLESLDPVALKKQLLDAIASARDLFATLPLATVGKVFLSKKGVPRILTRDVATNPKLLPRDASAYGSLPVPQLESSTLTVGDKRDTGHGPAD
jgi:hypothetical protein